MDRGLPQAACWLRLRVWSLARKVVSRAVRVRQQLWRANAATSSPPAPAGARSGVGWTGPRLWN
jgi:hypothetical protein